MAQNGENILFRIVPLILIIAVSWFFSFLSAKAKKRTQQTPQEQQTQPEKGSMDLFFGMEDDAESPKLAPGPPEQTVPGADPGTTLWKPQAPEGHVTPKPIEPKWWGA